MIRVRTVLCALACCAALWLQPAAHAADLQGTFVPVKDQGADIDAAIEAAIAPMNFIKRPIARSRLKKTNMAYQRIRITHAADAIELTFDQRQPLRVPTSGAPVKWTREDGEVFDVSVQWDGTQLVQTYKAKDGMRVNTFRLREEGHTLDLGVAVSSGQLPQAVRYTLVYRRIE